MPVVEGVTTKTAESVWKSPDGQREIFEVKMDYQGQEVIAKTYSKDIATVGWSGTVLTDERPNRKGGTDTFVKQPPKEQGGYGGNPSGNRGSYQGKDEKAIQAMWAIGQSIAAHNGNPEMDVAELESVKAYAIELNRMVDEVKTGGASSPAPTDTVAEVKDRDDPGDLLDSVQDMFPGSEKVEKPWPPKT